MKKIFENSFFLLLAEVINPLLSAGMVIVFARVLGAENLGAYSLVLNWVVVFQIFSCMGLRPLIIRKVSQKPKQWSLYLSGAILIVLLSTIFFIVAMIIVAQYLNISASTRFGLILLSFTLLPSGIYYLIESVLFAHQIMKSPAIINLVSSGLKVIFGITGVVLFRNLYCVFIIIFIVKFLSVVILYSILQKNLGSFRFYWRKRFSLMLFRSTLIFMALSTISALYWRLDILMLSTLTNEFAIGIYSGAYRFFAMAMLISDSFSTAIYPVFSKLHFRRKEEFKHLCVKAIKYLIIILLPVSVLLFLFSHEIILTFYGNEFRESIKVFQILISSLLPLAIASLLARALLASGRQNIDLFINSGGLILNFLLNLFLIPKFSYLGAAMATLTVTLVNLLILLIIMVRFLFEFRYLKGLLKLIGIGAILVLMTQFIYQSSMILKISLPVIIYLSALKFTRIFNADELKTLKSTFVTVFKIT